MSVSLSNMNEKTLELKKLYIECQQELSLTGNLSQELNNKYVKCITMSSELIKLMDTLNPFEMNRHKKEFKDVYFTSAELLSRTVGLHNNRNGFTEHEKSILHTCVSHLQKSLNIEPFYPEAKELFKIILIYLTIYNGDAEENIKLLNNVLMVDPCDYQLHYNLGFMYHRINNLEKSLYHYKLAVGIIDLQLNSKDIKDEVKSSFMQFKVKCMNGLGSVYFAIQDRELANYFFFEGLKISPDDPDLNNQIGVVFTELRYTDKAIKHYKHGIDNFDKAHISTDKDMLLASMYMNMGLAYCYEINYPEAIDCYNKALKYKPRLSLAYQNKLLDLNYISHMIDDPMYIAKLHKDINKIYPQVIMKYDSSYKIKQNLLDWDGDKTSLIKKGTKVNVGFISGDFICHPVSYFLNCILKHINYDIFNVHCYSLKVVQLNDMFPKCEWKVVKGTSPEQLKTIIQNDSIDILFDLASQTGDNRLDTFVLKPAPIQISYCGYPNTSGLNNMDYHIVDHYCDSDGVNTGPGNIVRSSTQKYYTEKLLFMSKCFLSYTPSIGLDKLPKLPDVQPLVKNNYLTIGTFNRYNKINDTVIQVWETILEKYPQVRFIIKTKEFLTETLRTQFVNTWKNKALLDRIQILDYSDLYTTHLADYNLLDIALDTFPYSGTTTSCEALMMGVPIVTLFDSNRQYHAQNVTTSLMINSNLEEYVAYSQQEYINKIGYFSTHLDELKDLKQKVRNSFINGNVCDHTSFVDELETKLLDVYKNHSW